MAHEDQDNFKTAKAISVLVALSFLLILNILFIWTTVERDGTFWTGARDLLISADIVIGYPVTYVVYHFSLAAFKRRAARRIQQNRAPVTPPDYPPEERH